MCRINKLGYIKILLTLVLFFSIADHSLATTWYISQSTGNDSWSGMLATPSGGDGPKQSISAANTLLNSSVQPGDSVLLKRGDTWTGTTGFALSEAAGTPDQLIIIGAYGTGAKPILDISGTGNIINIRGSYKEGKATVYVKFECLRLTTTAVPGNRPVGIYINETYRPFKPHHIIFDSLDIVGLKHGLTLYLSHHTLQNCLIKDNYGISPETGFTQGLYMQGHHITLRNNTFEHNGRIDSWFDHNLYVSAGTHYLIEDNEFKNALDGIKLRQACSTIVRGNHIHHMDLSAINVGGDDQGGINTVTIENNIIHNTVDGIQIRSQSGNQTELTENIIIRNNILYNNRINAPIGGDYPGYISVLNESPLKDIQIYNNLVYGCEDEYNLYINAVNPRNVQIKNNIFYRTSTDQQMVRINTSSVFSGITMNNNLYHFPGGTLFRVGSNEYKDLASFQMAYSTQESNGVQGDPLFYNAPSDFHLTAASANAIDRGTDLTGFVDTDREGGVRPVDGDSTNGTAWDIGPYEYNSGSGIIKIGGTGLGLPVFKMFLNSYSKNLNIKILMQNAHCKTQLAKLKIFDIKGRLVYSQFPNSNSQLIWDTSNVLPGLYMVHLNMEGRSIASLKVIIK